ncbi:unnamed protein product, partial [Rotaria socialis]
MMMSSTATTTSNIVEEETMTESDNRKSFLISSLLSASSSNESMLGTEEGDDDDDEEGEEEDDENDNHDMVKDIEHKQDQNEKLQTESTQNLHRAFPKMSPSTMMIPRVMSSNDFSYLYYLSYHYFAMQLSKNGQIPQS